MTDTRLDKLLCYGTAADRGAFTPDPPAGVLVLFYEEDTGDVYLWDTDAGPAAWIAFPGGGGVSDGDKGDITVSSSGAAWTIDNNAVTYAKMQDVSATSRVLGRKTAGSGDVEELTLSEVLDLIGSAAHGDVLYRGSSGWARLAAGTSGQYLQTQGAGANPQWAAGATSYTDEMARDAIGAALTAGTGISVSVNDGADTITVASTITQYTDEMARDALGTALVAGSGITITPNDGSDTITIAASGAAADFALLHETVVSGSAASDVTVSSGLTGYRHLEILVAGRGTTAATNVRVKVQFNSDTGNNYDYLFRQSGAADQSAFATSAIIMGWITGSTAPSNGAASAHAVVYDAEGTTFMKVVKTLGTLRTSSSAAFTMEGSGFWNSTSAITAIKVSPESGNFAIGTVVSIYGRN